MGPYRRMSDEAFPSTFHAIHVPCSIFTNSIQRSKLNSSPAVRMVADPYIRMTAWGASFTETWTRFSSSHQRKDFLLGMEMPIQHQNVGLRTTQCPLLWKYELTSFKFHTSFSAHARPRRKDCHITSYWLMSKSTRYADSEMIHFHYWSTVNRSYSG